PRSSLTVVVTVAAPACAFAVFSTAVSPRPVTAPLSLAKVYVRSRLSGLVPAQRIVTFSPTCTVAGVAVQVTVGGFMGAAAAAGRGGGGSAHQLQSPRG